MTIFNSNARKIFFCLDLMKFKMSAFEYTTKGSVI